MKDFSQRITALSPEQKILWERRLKEKELKNSRSKLINSSQQNSATGVLSSAQERLWLLHQLQPELPLYNEISLIQLTGCLDIAILEQSFNRVLQRHQVLRSKFITKDGKPVAQIAPSLMVNLPLVEIEGETNPEARAIALATQEARKPFDLAEFPLFRLRLYRVAENRYLWLMVIHHIICDGWSMGIFIKEIATVYADLKLGKSPSLPELPIQYVDFALWEKQLPDNILATQLNYWEKQLKGTLPKLELPSLNRQITTNIDSSRGGRESVLLSPQLSQRLKTLSQQQNVTLFMLLLAVFKVLLSRHTDLTDILVGSPIANRSRPELEGIIGIFINTLVLRSDLSADSSFSEFLQQVKQVSLEAYGNQDLPFEQLVAQLDPERNVSQSPLFQAMFILYNLPTSDLELPGLKVEAMPIDNGMALFDLTLEIRDNNRGLDVCFEYNSDRFGADESKRLLLHYQTILEQVVINPDVHLSQIEILTEVEKQKLLFEFNDNSRNYPVTQTIERLFEAQVAKTPGEIAVVDRNTKLTYQQLNAQANQIARLLQSLGLKPGEFVSIWQERSVNFAVAILAVLKAGGVYVPIDSSYPPERIAHILRDSQSQILLSDRFCLQDTASILANCHSLKHIICVDDCTVSVSTGKVFKTYTGKNFQELSTDNLEGVSAKREIEPTGVESAYMIYTSGSTGLPKGAMIRHGGAINHIYGQYDALNLGSDLIFLQSAPASSDISVWQFIAPILIGGKTIVIDTETVCNPEKLWQTIQEHKITLVELVPVVLKSLLNYLASLPIEQRQSPYLQWMMVTGESVSVNLVNDWLKLYPTIAIVNAYGPSEASDDITQAIIDQPLSANQSIVSIGQPLANLNLYILDSNLNLLPIGVPGEICISGYGVGVGYWQNKAKTQASFITNPFPENSKPLPGVETDLLYKTGDLGRWFPDGSIEYLGRIDNQVKIRGFRIELGEIEAVIQQNLAIQDCVVISGEDSLGEKRLIAYYISEQQLDSKQLRKYLKQKLPDYMIPAAWVQLDTFPLTPNGKCDRNSLPIPDSETSTTEYIAPRTSQEDILASIWQEVLHLKQVGVNDNFFELGGHSLLATQVVSKIRQNLAVELPLRYLFEHPTVAELASQLQHSVAADIPPIKAIARGGDLPLSFAQQRLWFLAQLEPDSPAYNGSSILELEGKLNLKALSDSINEIVRRHEVLRTSFTVVDGQPRQKIASKLKIDLELINLLGFAPKEQKEEVKRLARAHNEEVFDLTQSPLFRLTLLRLSANKYLLLITMHHIISDAWSTGIFINELSEIYTAFADNRSHLLPELAIQYADFAVWQRQLIQGEFLDSQLTYWQRQLNQLPTLNLPASLPREEVTTNPSESETFIISADLAQAINLISRQAGVSLFMTMLAVLQVLLQRYTSQDDIVIGADVANRNRSEIEPLIGFFINLLVLRTDLSGNPSFTELLQRVRQVTLGAYDHQDLPFDRLVKALQPQRYLNHTPPLFQVLLVLQNTPLPAFELPELSLKMVELEETTTRFDLALFLKETEAGIEGKWQYNADLFDSNIIINLSNHFQNLLQSVTTKPDARLGTLKMLSDREIEAQNKIKQVKKASKLAKFKAIKT